MPVEHGLWGYEERAPPLAWDQAGEQGNYSPVGPTEPRPSDLATEHRQLVPQDEDLGVLGERIGPVDSDEPEHPPEELVEEREGHGRAAWPTASELVKPDMGVIGPFRRLARSSVPAPPGLTRR